MSVGPEESKSKEDFMQNFVCKQIFYRSILHSVGVEHKEKAQNETGGL